MSKKYIIATVVGAFMMIGWNVFIIQRDAQLFNSYNQETPKEKYCKQQANWHPDCNVE